MSQSSKESRNNKSKSQTGKNQKKMILIIVLIIAAVFIIIGLWIHSRNNQNDISETNPSEAADNSSAADGTESAETESTGTESTDAAEDTEDTDQADDTAATDNQADDTIATDNQTNDTTATDNQADSAGNELPEVENSGSLVLSSVYTSSIMNPDCGDAYAEEIASLEISNSSSRYLLSATLTATMSDGSEVQFQVSDLPAGATAEIFDTANQTMDSDVTCTSLTCTDEEYLEDGIDVLMSDSITITADGGNAILTNTGGSALTGLTVVYHCDMAGQYFGGTSYTTTIESLAAGESYTLSDSALMGEVAVVRIYQ